MSARPEHEGGLARARVWIGAQTGWRGAALTVAAGALGALGFAPFHIIPAFALAITIFVWRIDGIAFSPRRRRAAFARSAWFGLGYFLVGTYWVSSAFLVDPDIWGPAWGIPATLALGGGIALLFWSPLFALFVPLWRRNWKRIPLFTLVLSLGEFLRGHVFGGFPWNLAGYVWPAGGAVSQLAAYLGIYGLSTLTILMAASPATIADTGIGRGARLLPALAATLGLGLAWGLGIQRLAQAPPPAADAPIVRVADAGLSQRDKWARNSAQEWKVLARYAAVTGPPETSRAQIVVWPEGAIPAVNFLVLENSRFLSAIGRLLGDRVLILGLTRRSLDERNVILYYNSAVIIDGVGGEPRVAQIYDKNRLVPFGEFIPLWSLISGANIAPLQQIGAGFTPGPRPSRMVVPDAPPVVVLICYEAIFTGLTPRGIDRPGWIVSITNDAWFGRATGPWQHFNMARYRAIEEGIPLVRAASGGISAVVDAYGRTVVQTGLDGGAAEARLPATLQPTLYSRLGSMCWTLVFLLIFLLYCAPTPADAAGAGKK